MKLIEITDTEESIKLAYEFTVQSNENWKRTTIEGLLLFGIILHKKQIKEKKNC